MNNADLDFSKYVEVPDEWIKKALAIPLSQAESDLSPTNSSSLGINDRYSRSAFLFSRRFIAAASAVLILCMSLAVYFLVGNIQNDLPAVPYRIVPSEEPTAGDAKNPTHHRDGGYVTSDPTSSLHSYPSEGSVSATAESDETASPSSPSSSDSAEKPTEKSTQKPTETQNRQTEPVRPTEPIDPTEDINVQVDAEIRDIYIVHPIEMIDNTGYNAAASSDVKSCCIYDSSGELLDDSPSSASRRIGYRIDGNYLCVYYRGSVVVPYGYSGVCTYIFYDENGTIIAAGTVTV